MLPKYLFVVLIVFQFQLATAQKMFSTSKDRETGQKVLQGRINLSDLKQEPSFAWFNKNENYQPDSPAIAFLSTELPKFDLIVFIGTWCEDSQDLIPKLTKIISSTHFPESQLVMYGVNREKNSGGVESDMFKIKRVPTFILLKNRKEIGRIMEHVSTSLETDLAYMIDTYYNKQQ